MSVELGESAPVIEEAVVVTGPETDPERLAETVVSEADIIIGATVNQLPDQLRRLHETEQDWAVRGVPVNPRHF